MAGSNYGCNFAWILLSIAVVGCEAVCTQNEKNVMLRCFEPHNQKMIGALGIGGTCDRADITSNGLCTSFASIVNCINCASLSDTECRPVGIAAANSLLVIPCEVEDFVAVCTDAPAIYEGKPNTVNQCNGCGGRSASFLLAMFALAAALISSLIK